MLEVQVPGPKLPACLKSLYAHDEGGECTAARHPCLDRVYIYISTLYTMTNESDHRRAAYVQTVCMTSPRPGNRYSSSLYARGRRADTCFAADLLHCVMKLPELMPVCKPLEISLRFLTRTTNALQKQVGINTDGAVRGAQSGGQGE